MQPQPRRVSRPVVIPLGAARHRQERSISSSPAERSQRDETLLYDYIVREEYALAMDILVQQYQDAIVSYCYSHFPERHVAHEVAQEIFLAAFESLHHFRGQSSLKTWLYGIATKKCLEVERTRARRAGLLRDHQPFIASTVHVDAPQQPDEMLSQERQRQQIWQGLRRLRVYDRKLLVLRYIDELTCEEIASILKVSRRTVERHIPRAEARFLKAYEKVRAL